MLHRLAHPQISRQREGAHQLRQPDPRIPQTQGLSEQ
jgi:hypothetical protein